MLYFFLIYDRKDLFIINIATNEVKRKVLSINNSLIFLIMFILVLLFYLYCNNYNGYFEIDSFSISPVILFTKQVYTGLTLLAFVLFIRYNRDIKYLRFEFFFAFLFVSMSSLLLLQANNLISFYIVVEIQSIVLYFLIAFDRTSSVSAEAGLKYFLISILMSTLFLLGVALIYITFGTTNLSYLSLLLYKLTGMGFAIYGFLFILIFILFKLAVVPFHFWALEVYEGASWPVIGVLAVLSKIPLVFFLIKLFLILGLDMNLNLNLNILLIILNFFGFISILVGTFGAVYYISLRKILVYSGIANIGYILLALGSSNFLVVVFSYIYFLVYSLSLLLLIYLVLFVFGFTYKDYSYQFKGLALKYPYLSFLFLILFFIFIGLPPLVGFWTKFLLLYGIIVSGAYFKALFIFISNILAAVYYLRVIREIYFGKSLAETKLKNKSKSKEALVDYIFLYIFVFLILSLVAVLFNFDLVIWIILKFFI
jgi:NADH-quinone oxidoreductase subunit N